MKITKNLEARIQKTFDWAKKTGVNFSGKRDKNVSNKTLDTYAAVVKTYNNWLEKTHGISADRAKPRHAYQYVQEIAEQVKKGEKSPFTLKKVPHALHAFQALSGQCGAFKRPCRVGDKRVMLGHINQEGIKRKAAESHSLKANNDDFEKVKAEMEKSNSKYKDYAVNVHTSQRQLGLRVHEAVKIQVQDINFTDKTVRVRGKGGLERNVPIRSEKYLEDLKELCAGKKGGAEVFRVQNNKGDPPSRTYREKIVKKEVRKAADQAGVARDGREYTSHSARKAFAQERVQELKQKHVKTIQKIFAEQCAEDERFKAKADQALRNIRSKIQSEKRNNRELTKKEKILFMVSCEIGHFRLDVMRYYVTY